MRGIVIALRIVISLCISFGFMKWITGVISDTTWISSPWHLNEKNQHTYYMKCTLGNQRGGMCKKININMIHSCYEAFYTTKLIFLLFLLLLLYISINTIMGYALGSCTIIFHEKATWLHGFYKIKREFICFIKLCAFY